MSPGQFARRILGERFEVVGKFYRGLFVDMNKVVEVFCHELPSGAHCLDVGGGDGLVAALILRRRPDVRITLIDIAPAVGGFIEQEFAHRVHLRPRTAVADLIDTGELFDAVIMADVIHHVPPAARAGFFADLAKLCRSAKCRFLLIKDVQPGSVRARLAVLSDHYVTGDKGVELATRSDLEKALSEAFGRERIEAFDFSLPDPPNFCLITRLRAADGTPPSA